MSTRTDDDSSKRPQGTDEDDIEAIRDDLETLANSDAEAAWVGERLLQSLEGTE